MYSIVVREHTLYDFHPFHIHRGLFYSLTDSQSILENDPYTLKRTCRLLLLSEVFYTCLLGLVNLQCWNGTQAVLMCLRGCSSF